ncbi:Class II abasic (AP) endonuclease [Haplosporangium sp. Z 27]|nr:Class II abasic (AP) endonuclease [Haplosporangium sp. Z 27]
MKFLTWNVNGIRSLIQYHPYCDDLHKNYREILDYLDADVICLQETRITRPKLEPDIALVPGYDSYWSFHRTRGGYSGVVIYIKDHIKLVAVEEGISGVLSGNFVSPMPSHASLSVNSPFGKLNMAVDPTRKKIGGYPVLDGDVETILARYHVLDKEGRGIILDFGFFVLFNLYCPNFTDDSRLPFKMDYYHLLEARVQGLINEGRQIIVMGDMNVVPTELDHCDPEKWKKEAGVDDFQDTLPRRWFNNFLAPNGPLTDLYRVFHKDESGAFTCWNTKINARPSNYGTRLDYILVTSGLVPWFKSCDRKPNIVGSDHCPVVAEMYTALNLEKSAEEKAQDSKEAEALRLQDIIDSFGGMNGHPLAAKYYEEFAPNQPKLQSFFKKPITQTLTHPTENTTTIPLPSSELLPDTTGNESKRHASQDTMDDEVSRKKPFFLTEKSTNTVQSSISSDSQPKSTPKTTVLSTSVPPPQKPNIKKPTKAGSSKPSTADKSGSKKPPAPKPVGQRSVLSFFSSPSKNPSSDTTAPIPVSEDTSEQTTSSDISQSLIDKDISVDGSQSSIASSSFSQNPDSLPLSSSSPVSDSEARATPTFSPKDFADWIPSSQDAIPYSINAEATTSKWQDLFQPRAVPKCRYHGIPCTEFKVNKKGANKGRRFFLCSLS